MKNKYSVKTFRAAGLEARWTKNRKGAPIIVARDPQAKLAHQRNTWWVVDAAMWHNMQADGIRSVFLAHTLIGDVFSIAI